MTAPPQPLVVMEGASFAEVGHGRVDGVSLSVAPGEIVMVTGPAGSGKSLVLRAAVGLAAPVAGAVSLFGIPLAGLNHDQLMGLRQRVAYASESSPLLSNLTVRDNLAMPLFLRGVKARDVENRVERIMHELGLANDAARRPHQISSLVHRMALLARALVLPAHLLVLDEPSRGLSAERNRAVLAALKARAEEGIGVLLSIGDPTRWQDQVSRSINLAPAPAA